MIMPNNLMDVMKGKYNDASVGIVEEVLKKVPELAFFDARIIDGTQFKTLARTGLPSAGFRDVNTGIDASGSTYAMKTFDLFVLDCLVKMDKAVAVGDIYGKDMALARESVGAVLAGMKQMAKQTWYGTANDAKGFPGAKFLTKTDLKIGNKSTGLTAATGSSVFAVGNSTLNACGYVFGGSGKGLLTQEPIDFKETLLKDGDDKEFDGFYAALTTWVGFSVVDARKVAFFDNITADTGATMNDEVLAQLVNKYMESNDGEMPDGLFMSFRSLQQLQLSRKTVLVAQGKTQAEIGTVAPIPQDYNGIRILPTNAIANNEALTSRT